jgi:hypothetical protein
VSSYSSRHQKASGQCPCHSASAITKYGCDLGASSWSYDPNTQDVTLNISIAFQPGVYGTTQGVWVATFQQSSWATTGWWQPPGWSWNVPAPLTISGVSPSDLLVGTTTTVTIFGTGFGTGPTISFGDGISVSGQSSSDTQIRRS